MYKIKHKETGLYYKPCTNNLSNKGKIYTTKTTPLTMNVGIPNIYCKLNLNSRAYKKFQHILDKYKSKYMDSNYVAHLIIPKEDFELETLVTMTLDEAISHCEEITNNNCSECGEEHKQLSEWLKELKHYRKNEYQTNNTNRKT